MRKIWIPLVVLVAGAAAFWAFSTDMPAPPVSTVIKGDPVGNESQLPDIPEDIVTERPGNSSPTTEQAAEVILDDQPSTEASPFDVVSASEADLPLIEADLEASTPIDDSASHEELDVIPAATAEQRKPDTQSPVVVPRSYPVTDAARYFIPKEDREPGKLGGPPPMDFPGGPSDPNRGADSQPLALPTVPGQ